LRCLLPFPYDTLSMILAREVYLQLVKHRPDNVDSLLRLTPRWDILSLLMRVQWADANMYPGLALFLLLLGRFKLLMGHDFFDIPTLFNAMLL
jgi:hypothetical protein